MKGIKTMVKNCICRVACSWHQYLSIFLLPQSALVRKRHEED